jgi:plasmid replication initiation protein
METNSIIVKANRLILSSYNLNLNEQRIIEILASTIQAEDKEFCNYEFKISDFIEKLEIKGQKNYTELPKIIDGLMKKTFKIKTGNKIEAFSWLAYYTYTIGSGIITLSFHPALKPYLLDLKKDFTKYSRDNILALRGKYAMRLYQILKSYQFRKEIKIEVEDLRDALELKDEYVNFAAFRSRVLEPAKSEINAKTDILFSYKEVTRGKKVVTLKLNIKSKKEIKETAITSTYENEKTLNEIIKIMENRVDIKSAQKIYEVFGKDLLKIKNVYEYSKDHNPKNIVKYMCSLVDADISGKPTHIKNDTHRNNNKFEERKRPDGYYKDQEDRLLGRGIYADPNKNVPENLEVKNFD